MAIAEGGGSLLGIPPAHFSAPHHPFIARHRESCVLRVSPGAFFIPDIRTFKLLERPQRAAASEGGGQAPAHPSTQPEKLFTSFLASPLLTLRVLHGYANAC